MTSKNFNDVRVSMGNGGRLTIFQADKEKDEDEDNEIKL